MVNWFPVCCKMGGCCRLCLPQLWPGPQGGDLTSQDPLSCRGPLYFCVRAKEKHRTAGDQEEGCPGAFAIVTLTLQGLPLGSPALCHREGTLAHSKAISEAQERHEDGLGRQRCLLPGGRKEEQERLCAIGLAEQRPPSLLTPHLFVISCSHCIDKEPEAQKHALH